MGMQSYVLLCACFPSSRPLQEASVARLLECLVCILLVSEMPRAEVLVFHTCACCEVFLAL